ncbi:hypothetical protein GMI70_07230 [Eggerthellaceae bacterium zg-893]|nr:hypothetical protein [Eggerthellaceae bacterium zg-893]
MQPAIAARLLGRQVSARIAPVCSAAQLLRALPAPPKTRAGLRMRPSGSDRSGKTMTDPRLFQLDKFEEESYFTPKTWGFWRGVIMYFFIFSLVGHWMEIPYCALMDALFGIVEPDYAAFVDPLHVPYWVYGAGTVVLTLVLLPLKISIVRRCKTLWGAALGFLVAAVAIAAVLETVIGLIINQPDAFGEYPYWDNSQLAGNILGQGWIVNDIGLGLVSLFYVWVVFPFCQKIFLSISPKAANRFFFIVLAVVALACVSWYVPQVFAALGLQGGVVLS